MLRTSLNIVKAYGGWGWAGGYLWHLKEVMVASGRFTVTGSGDGLSRYAYNGVTGALAGGQQGSGGAYDCLQNPKFTDAASKQAGYWNASGWLVVNEVGSSRQYLFASTDQTAAGWDGYGRVSYNPGGGATPAFNAAAASATAIPAAATNEQWLFGASRATANGNVMGMAYAASGYIHIFCEDTLESGVCSFGWYTSPDTRVLDGLVVCPIVGGPAWDPDPVIFLHGSQFGTISTFNQFGTVNQAWVAATINKRTSYTGAQSSRITDGSTSILPMAVTSGAGANAYLKGYTGESVGFTPAKWTYPTLTQDRVGNRWIPGPAGLMLAWPDTALVLPR